jgi:uracil-DNA glycosylase family 4
VRCRSRVVPGDGDVPAEIAFVGLAPGRFGGDRTGVPFSGDRSGHLLRRMLEHAGLSRAFITNLVRCNPRDVAGRNRDPTREEIANCRDHLVSELDFVQPRIVVCLGRVAWRELAGASEPFAPRRARLIQQENWLLYPMYHPAYVNRGALPATLYARHFTRLARLLADSAIR